VHRADQRHAEGGAARFRRAVNKDATMLVSSVVAFELWYGVAKSERKEANTQRLEAFLAVSPNVQMRSLRNV